MKILLIGETCFDENCYGDCLRLNPEAPTPVFTPKHSTANLGMAANVKSNLLSLSGNKVEVELVTTVEKITKTRYIDETSNYILLRVDKNDKVLPICGAKLSKIEKTASECDAVVVSSYNKGFLAEKELAWITSVANKAAVPIFVDTKTILGEWSRGVDFVKINTKEYNANLARLPFPWLYCKTLIVTKGAEGAAIFQGGEMQQVEGFKVEVSQVAGAGDSFLAGLVLEYVKTSDIVQAVRFANKVASVAVSKRGIVAVKAEEVC